VTPSLDLRALPLAAAALAMGAVFAGPAAAHVTVQPGTATQGGFTAVSFRVPTERADAGTTRLAVTFPTEQPLASARVKPHPGWSYRLQKAKLQTPLETEGGAVTEAVRTITWTADGAGSAIKPGEFDEFTISLGPLPKAEQMVFRVVQTYSDGEVVRWIEQASPGAEEPEHPAPVLKLTAPAAAAAPAPAAPAPAARPSTASRQPAATADSGSAVATWLSAAALVLSVVAVALAALLGRRRAGVRTGAADADEAAARPQQESRA
jgi:uncharacterized protein YcnI